MVFFVVFFAMYISDLPAQLEVVACGKNDILKRCFLYMFCGEDTFVSDWVFYHDLSFHVEVCDFPVTMESWVSPLGW